jgi:tRNA(Ile)-lysidine synthase
MISLSDFQLRWSTLRNAQVFLACSGGVDSVVLLHLLKQAGAAISVLHVNYQLRGAASEGDEMLVQHLCMENDIPFQVRRVDTKKILAENGGNLQELARELRYDWFREVLAQDPESFIALGHHADDQVETFFQHLARKSGILGMAGMLERNGRFIRPLLTYDKDEIYAFAHQNQLSWREDVSNSGSAYTRNRLRNLLLPELYVQLPDLKKSVLTLVEKFQQAQQELESEVGEQLSQIRRTGHWPFAAYDAATSAQIAEILRSLGIRSSHVPILAQLRQSQKGGKINVDHCTITREQDHFFLGWRAEDKVFALRIEVVSELPETFSKQAVFLNPLKLHGKLRLRPWKTGDRMQPIGLNGTKLISDILTESGMPSHARAEALVLTDDRDIHWCVGLKVGAKARADASTRTIWQVSVD